MSSAFPRTRTTAALSRADAHSGGKPTGTGVSQRLRVMGSTDIIKSRMASSKGKRKSAMTMPTFSSIAGLFGKAASEDRLRSESSRGAAPGGVGAAIYSALRWGGGEASTYSSSPPSSRSTAHHDDLLRHTPSAVGGGTTNPHEEFTASSLVAAAGIEARPCVLRSEFDKLFERLTESQLRCENLDQERRRLEDAANYLRSEVASWDRRCTTLEGTNEHAERVLQRNNELEIEISQMQDSMESTRESLAAENRLVMGERDALRVAHRVLQREFDAVEEEKTRFAEMAIAADNERDRRNAAEEELQVLTSRLAESEDAHERQGAVMASRLSKLQSDKAKLQERLSGLEMDMQTLAGTNDHAEAVVHRNAELSRLVAEMQNEKENLEERYRDDVYKLEVAFETQKIKTVSFQEQLEDANSQVVALRQAEEGLRSTLTADRAVVAEAKKVQVKLQEMEDELTATRDKHADELAALHTRLQHKTSQLAGLEDTNSLALAVTQRNTVLETKLADSQRDYMEKNQELCRDRDDYKSKLQSQLLKIERIEEDSKQLQDELRIKELDSSKQFQTLKSQIEDKLKDQRDKLNAKTEQTLAANAREIEALSLQLNEQKLNMKDIESLHSHCPDPAQLEMERRDESKRIMSAVSNGCKPLEARVQQLEDEKVSLMDEFELRNSALRADWQASMTALADQHKQETIAREKTYNASLKEKKEQLSLLEARQRLAVDRAVSAVRDEAKHRTDAALQAAAEEHSWQYEQLLRQNETVMVTAKRRAEAANKKLLDQERSALQRQVNATNAELEQVKMLKAAELKEVREAASAEVHKLRSLLEKMATRGDTPLELERELAEKSAELVGLQDRSDQLESLLEDTRMENERRHEALQAANERLDAMLRRNAELERIAHHPSDDDQHELLKLRKEVAEANHNLAAKREALKNASRLNSKLEETQRDLTDDVKRLTAENGHLLGRIKLTNDLREKASLLDLENRRLANEARVFKEQLANFQDSNASSGDNLDEHYAAAKIARLEDALRTVTEERDVVLRDKEMLEDICVENEAKQKAIDQLKHRIAEKDSEIDRKSQEIQEAERTAVSPRHADDADAIAELQRRVDLLSAEKSGLVTDREILQDELETERSQLMAKLELKERQLQSLTSTHEHARELLRRNTELEDLLDKLRREREVDFDERQQRLTDEHQERLNEFRSTRIEVLKAQLREEYQTYIQELSAQGAEKDIIVEKLRERIEYLETDQDNKDAQQALLSQDLTEMELKNKMLSSEIKGVQQRLAARRDRESAQERRTAELETTITQLEQLLQRSADLEGIIIGLQQEKEESIKNIQYELQVVTDENERSAQALEALHNHQQWYERRLADLNGELEAVRKEKSILERQTGVRIHVDAKRSTDRVKELIAELGALREQHKQAANQMASLQERNQKLETYLHDVDEEHQENIQKLGKAIDILKEELQSKENTIQAVRRHNTTQDEEVRTLRDALRRLAVTSSPRSTSRLSVLSSTATNSSGTSKSFVLPPSYSSANFTTTGGEADDSCSSAAAGFSTVFGTSPEGTTGIRVGSSFRRRHSHPSSIGDDRGEYSLGKLRNERGTVRVLSDVPVAAAQSALPSAVLPTHTAVTQTTAGAAVGPPPTHYSSSTKSVSAAGGVSPPPLVFSSALWTAATPTAAPAAAQENVRRAINQAQGAYTVDPSGGTKTSAGRGGAGPRFASKRRSEGSGAAAVTDFNSREFLTRRRLHKKPRPSQPT